MRMPSVITLTVLVVVVGLQALAQTQMDARLRPSGPIPKPTLSTACRQKLIVASDAVREINTLGSEREYQDERQDAKRAIREAHAAVSTEGDNAVWSDISMY